MDRAQANALGALIDVEQSLRSEQQTLLDSYERERRPRVRARARVWGEGNGSGSRERDECSVDDIAAIRAPTHSRFPRLHPRRRSNPRPAPAARARARIR